MTKKQAVRCLKCLTLADPVCACGAVASQIATAFCGEQKLVVYADSFLDWEIIWAWYDDKGELQYVEEVPGKQSAEYVVLPDDVSETITKELSYDR